MLEFSARTVLLFILSLIVSEVSSDCRKTFGIHCDNLNDYLNYETDTWRELIVGHTNDKPTEEWNLFNLWVFLIQDLDKLESLTINNQLHGKIIGQIHIDMKHAKLKYLHFYKNKFDNFHLNMFSDFPSLIQLNLIDNNIKQIIGGGPSIDTVDFSGNKLTEIKENTFSGMEIRQLIIKSNQLSSIEVNAFNKRLEILHLDHNELGYIPEDSLENLVHLKVLTMSHNQISLIPKLDFLKSIEKFDFSYNKITNIRTKFQSLPNLKHIDLSHNLIKRINFVSLIPRNEFPKKISIAFNHLTQFQLSDEEWQFNFTAPVTLLLFGNPWICECLDEMDLFLKDRPFKRTECDLSLFGNGRFPHCVNQEFCISRNVASDASFHEGFLKVLNESEAYFTCNIDLDMLNLVRPNRQYAFVGLPITIRRVGNQFKSIV